MFRDNTVCEKGKKTDRILIFLFFFCLLKEARALCRYRMGMSSAIFHLPMISVDITANCEFYFCPCWRVLDAIVRTKEFVLTTYFYYLRQTGNIGDTRHRTGISKI